MAVWHRVEAGLVVAVLGTVHRCFGGYRGEHEDGLHRRYYVSLLE